MENKAIDRPRTSTLPSIGESKWVDRFFNSPLDEFFNFGKVVNVPAVNVSETDNEYKLIIASPGLEKKDFKVEVRDDLLTISAEKTKEEKEERNGHYNRREYNYSSWSRSFTLPDDSEGSRIDAKYENGELKISIPKTAGKEKRNVKNISVN
ncbi:MAG: Hsp20/alpha crystallin family protein [Bacteroidota bacterium]